LDHLLTKADYQDKMPGFEEAMGHSGLTIIWSACGVLVISALQMVKKTPAPAIPYLFELPVPTLVLPVAAC
jgi:hypothetical protein